MRGRAFATALAAGALGLAGCGDSDDGKVTGFGDTVPPGFHILVEPGSEQGAIDYYKKLDAALTGPFTTLDEVLVFAGYSSLKAADVEKMTSQELIDLGKGDIAASRFFAPKISDVSGIANPRTYGWRKVVALRPRKPSGAVDKKVSSVYLLFNHFIEAK